jgi:asparagine synthase (glutamine-hydrolysing)
VCGLTGFIGHPGGAGALHQRVRIMADALAHRGPDDSGEWVDAEMGLAMGFRRLAIIDLSPAGHQPMVSASGRFVATMNGEIYNFEDLRKDLGRSGQAPTFRGHSDTEVMLASFDAWGIDAAVPRFNGMFGIAAWDRLERKLHLVRDRMGVKPLYYGFAGPTFMYGSELKALRCHPDFTGRIDRGALQLYLRFTYVPAPYSIYEGVSKVMPGTIVTFDPKKSQATTETYWSVRDAAKRGMESRFQGSFDEAAQEVDELARDAIRIRMVADVPLGVMLSGGIDSSLVTALMQAQSGSPVRSFSIGFTDTSYNEAPYAAAVAERLGTHHTALTMTVDDVLDVIPGLPSMYDEPFGDSSQMPTHLVSRLARQDVTVCLSGDGGDELFGGYLRYFMGERLLSGLAMVPRLMQPMLGRALTAVPPEAWDRVLQLGHPLLPRLLRQRRPGERIHKVARVLRAADPDAMYFELVSHWSEVVVDAGEATAPVTERADWPSLDNPIERMMFFDQISYLPDDILVKVDRASMAVALEAREPLLDYRLVEFAWRLPLSMKVRGGKGKPVLRKVLAQHLPSSLIDRPKMGFGIPLEQWLRGPLRVWAESLLDPSLLSDQGLIDPKPIRAKWDEHLAGKADWKFHLWSVLMFQAWLDSVVQPSGPTPVPLAVGRGC